MGNDRKYDHHHEKSSDWFRKIFIKFSVGGDRHRNVHHHKIIDRDTGASGEGWGWSYQQAEKKAWDDLKSRQGL